MKIFCWMPLRYSGFDYLFPLFKELKSINKNVEIDIIVNEDVLKTILLDNFNKSLTENLISQVIVNNKKTKFLLINFFNKFIFYFRICFYLMGIKKNTYFIHSSNLKKSNILKIISFFLRRKKCLILRCEHSIVLREKNNPTEHSPIIKNQFKEDGDFFLYSSINDHGFLKYTQRKSNIMIGYTRLYKSWINYVSDYTKKYIKFRKGNEKIISLFMPSVVKGITEESEVEEWSKTIALNFKKLLPQKSIIIVKPHPLQNKKFLMKILKIIETFSRSDFRIIHSNLNTAVLANISDLVVTHHTQAIIDTFAFKTPVIHYQKITKAWKKYWKKESHFNYFGVKLIQTEEDLHKKLKMLMSKKIKTNYKNINEFTNLSIFKRK